MEKARWRFTEWNRMTPQSQDKLENLIKEAMEKTKYCYAPYSRIRVVAILITDRGVFHGVNIENASYGLTICAERVAVFKAISEGAKKLKRLLVYSPDTKPYPCGACLQVLSEFADEDLEIIVASGQKEKISIEKFLLRDLLPHRFRIR